MVKFKCKHTGNIYTYSNSMDIKTMREHEEYEEVKNIPVAPKKLKNVSSDSSNQE